MNQRKTILSIGIGAAAAAAVLGAVWAGSQKPKTAGQKELTVEVIHKDGSRREMTIEVDEPTIGEALLEEGLIEGEEGAYGLFVTTVDGETADFDRDGGWWQLSVNGEEATEGASSLTFEDGDVITWTYVQ